jgi:hypothetical protein
MSIPVIPVPVSDQNWLITPAALAFAERPPASILDQKWLLVLTGTVNANQPGGGPGGWTDATLSFSPGMTGPNKPLTWAILKYGIPVPGPSNYAIGFAVDEDECAPFVSLTEIQYLVQTLDVDQDVFPQIDAGYGVSGCQVTFNTGTDAFFKTQVENIFTGVNVNVSVRNADAQIVSLGYNITLRGRIVFTLTPAPSPPPPRELSPE